VIITWVAAGLILWYAVAHIHETPHVLVRFWPFSSAWAIFTVSAASVVWAAQAAWAYAQAQAEDPPTRTAPAGTGIPSRVGFAIVVTVTFTIGPTVMLTHAVAGWVVLGVGVIVAGLYITVVLISAMAQDPAGREAAADATRITSDIERRARKSVAGAETPPADPPSSGGASGSGTH
jgi:hypothetical protein